MVIKICFPSFTQFAQTKRKKIMWKWNLLLNRSINLKVMWSISQGNYFQAAPYLHESKLWENHKNILVCWLLFTALYSESSIELKCRQFLFFFKWSPVLGWMLLECCQEAGVVINGGNIIRHNVDDHDWSARLRTLTCGPYSMWVLRRYAQLRGLLIRNHENIFWIALGVAISN